jgi:hypothetical protein
MDFNIGDIVKRDVTGEPWFSGDQDEIIGRISMIYPDQSGPGNTIHIEIDEYRSIISNDGSGWYKLSKSEIRNYKINSIFQNE